MNLLKEHQSVSQTCFWKHGSSRGVIIYHYALKMCTIYS